MKRKIWFKGLLAIVFIWAVSIKSVLADDIDKYNIEVFPNAIYKKYVESPFEVKSGSNEIVNPATGDMEIRQTDLYLKGKNGLDLNLTRYYTLSQSNMYEYAVGQGDSNTYDDINVQTANEKYYDIGAGWAFDLPYVELRSGYPYLHNGSAGTLYLKNFNASERCYYPEDYELKDFQFYLDEDRSYSNGVDEGLFILKDKQGKRTYFNEAGLLIGIVDRFGNEIKFYYTVKQDMYGSDRYLIRKIVDSLKREVYFDYDTPYTTKNNETWNNCVIIWTTDNNRTKKIIYKKVDIKESLSEDDERRREIVEGEYKLDTVVDVDGRETKYEYDYKEAKGSLRCKYLNDGAPKNYYACLEYIIYPNKSKSLYIYTYKNTKHCGIDGAMEFYKLFNRIDYKADGGSYNSKCYLYKRDGTCQFDGYPYNYSEFKVKSMSTKKGSSEFYTFNEKLQCTNILKKTKDYKKEIINRYDSNEQLSKTIEKIYNAARDYIKTVEDFEYDKYRNLLNYWGVEAKRDLNDDLTNKESDNHKIAYEYKSAYNYLTKKTYKKDKDTIIEEDYSLSPDKKNIQSARVYENSILKGQTEYFYDSYGNLIENRSYTKDSSGKWTDYISKKYSYDDNMSRPQFNGAFLTKQWIEGVKDADGNIKGRVEQKYKYDYFGNLIEQTDGNKNPILYEYDILGRVTKETNPDLTCKSYQYNDVTKSMLITDEKGNKINIVYYDFGSIKYEQDVETVETYDTSSPKYKDNGPFVVTGKIIKEYKYDSSLRLKKEITNNDNNTCTIKYDYYDSGRIRRKYIKDSEESKLRSEYYTYQDVDPQRKYSKITKKVQGDSSSKWIITTTYINKAGNIAKIERQHDSNNYIDTFKYDYLGNKTEEVSARANDENWTEPSAKYEYDFAGRLIKQYNIKGDYSSTEYDELGRVKAVTDIKGNKLRNGDESNKKYSTTFEYDNLGRVIKEKIPFKLEDDGTVHYSIKKHYYDKNGNLTKELVTKNKIGEPEDFNKIEYQYNNRNMLTKVITYDKDKAENYTQYFYDKVGNKLRMYTALSQPLTINGLDDVQANGDNKYSVTKYEYNKFGNLTKRIDPLNKEETYDKYNNTGSLLQKTDRNKNNIIMTYDGLNRLRTRTVTTPSGEGNTSAEYTYTVTGQVSTITSSGIKTEYFYNDLGRLYKEVTGAGTDNKITKEYTYDAANNRKSFVLSINDSVKSKLTYKYDKLNRLVAVNKEVNGVPQEVASYTYNENGNRVALNYPNGISVDYKYNLVNQLTELSNKKGANVLSKFNYTYYLDGNREKEIEERADETSRVRNFNYDGLGRLQIETEAGEEPVVYNYDDNNNREKMDMPKDWYDFEKSFQEVSYKYNGLNQLTNATIGNTTANYTYNAAGLRTSKTVNGNTINHIWDSQSLIAETDADAEIISEYIRGINLLAVEKDNKRLFYLYNGHGDVVQLADEAGNVIKNYEYDSFGNENNIDENDTNPFRYGGEYYDSETGLYYLRARYYDPKIGRFIAEDPIYAGVNWYNYCENNPIGLIDPLGLESIVVSGGDYSDESIKEGFSYNFIESAIREIVDLRLASKDENIAWLIAGAGWSDDDWSNFYKSVKGLNIHVVKIRSQKDLISYINNKNGGDSRINDKITSFSVYSHGKIGYLSLGYNYNKKYNKNLDFDIADIKNIHSEAFDNPISSFYSCNTGTKEEGTISFAQAWVNKIGGETSAFEGKSSYWYTMYPREYSHLLTKIARKCRFSPWLEYRDTVAGLRYEWGFSKIGSLYYPEAGDGARLVKFRR